MELLQSINGGAISADYTLHLSFGIIGFLLVALAGIVGKHLISALNKIERRLDDHDDKITKLKEQHIVASQESIQNRMLIEQIDTKLDLIIERK